MVILPQERLWIHLDIVGDTRRHLLITAQGDQYVELLYEFRQSAFGV